MATTDFLTTTAQTTPQTSFTQTTPTISPTTYNSQTQPVLTPTISPAIITSKPAQEDYSKIQSGYQEAATGIATQKANLLTQQQQAQIAAAKQAEQDALAQEAARKQKETDTKAMAISGVTADDEYQSLLGQRVYNPTTGKYTTLENIARNPGGTYSLSFADSPNTQFMQEADMGKLTYTKEQIAQDELDTTNEEYRKQAEQVQTTLTNIQNGTIPLNEGQISQINALKAQFQQLIDQQTLINTGASGIANIRGYQTGSAEYDPTFQAKTIGTIVNVGLNKIAELNIKMASAVAALEQSFRDDNAGAAKEAWRLYQDAVKDRQTQLQRTIDDAQKKVKEAQDKLDEQEKNYYTNVVKPIQDITMNIAKIPGVSSEVIAKVSQARTVTEAIEAAGTSLQTATGDLGDYLYVRRQAEASGSIPPSYEEWTARKNQEKINQVFRETLARTKATNQGRGGTPAGGTNSYSQTKATQTLAFVDKAIEQTNEFTAGSIRAVASGALPGSRAKDLQATLNTIKANIGFAELQAMREASKTGGALGQVAVQELEALQATLGSLDRSQSPDQLIKNLTAIKTHYQKALGIIDQIQNGNVGVKAILQTNNIPEDVFLQIKLDYPNLSEDEIIQEMRSQGIIQ